MAGSRGRPWKKKRKSTTMKSMLETKWRAQCDAARRIKQDYGSRKALGYLVGEKLLGLMRGTEGDPARASVVSSCVADVRTIFEPAELVEYFLTVKRVGPLGHAATDEQFRLFASADAIVENPLSIAKDAIRLGRVKDMFLGGGSPE